MAQIGPLSISVFKRQGSPIASRAEWALTGDKTLEEWLFGQIFVVFLQMLF